MILKNTDLTTLELHLMPEKSYEREKAAGRLDENAIYLVEDEFDAESAIKELQQIVAQKSQVQIIRWGADD